MNYLSTLLPAEILIIKDYKDTEIKEILKFTFMDLLMKGVLETITVQSQSRSRSKIRENTYVIAGKRFDFYTYRNYELAFLSPFRKSKSVRILFKHMVKMSFENVREQGNMKRLVAASQACDAYFSFSIIQRLFGNAGLTSQGLTVQQGINQEIQELQRKLPTLIAENSSEVAAILKRINGNVFLIKGINLGELSEMDAKILEEINRDTYASSSSGCFYYWDTYNSYSSEFDSGCSSSGWFSSGCSSSGCSSSGCSSSGCSSGCGGCGGCS